ncbi:hypothetical protein BHE74_00036977 [Ensete ventricosum]|nr:hypothetical protein BHE74_00036977 [Ensete ventricosum]
MRWDLTGSSLGDPPKETGSSLGTRRKIAGKKIGGLAVRLPEVTGICRIGPPVPQNSGDGQHFRRVNRPNPGFDIHPKKISSGCQCASRRRTRKWT